MPTPLSQVPLLQPVVLQAVGGDRSVRRRLMELGLVPGITLCVRKVAPMGDPLELGVRGGSLSIRRLEADQLTVELAGGRS